VLKKQEAYHARQLILAWRQVILASPLRAFKVASAVVLDARET